MLSDSLERKLKEFQNNYQEVYSKLKWTVDTKIIALISSIFVMNEKQLIMEDFLDVSQYIKENVGLFSPLRSYQRYTTAAMLMTRYENPKVQFQELLKCQEKLIDGGFKKGPYTSIAALALMTNEAKNENLEYRVHKALEIYKGMRANHFFLTSQGDYPLAVLLSEVDQSVDSLMEQIESYYSRLGDMSFRKGNDLQFLSHILMLSNTQEGHVLVRRCDHIFETLKEHHIKVRALHYPQIGLMAMIEGDLSEQIRDIGAICDELSIVKGLKWSKDINLAIAIIFVIKDQMSNLRVMETGINTTIEAIIQAQNAAMIAAIASASAATAASTT